MKKGIGPRGLGAPKSAAKMYGAKSPAKQVEKKQDYYNLKPKDAKTYADSVAVENTYFSGRRMGEVAGKIASGGKLNGNMVLRPATHLIVPTLNLCYRILERCKRSMVKTTKTHINK